MIYDDNRRYRAAGDANHGGGRKMDACLIYDKKDIGKMSVEINKNKYILMPDSFKGTMSSEKACEIMESAILKRDADAEVVSIPVADGGEGTVDCFLHAFKGEKVFCDVTGPLGEKIESYYAKFDAEEFVLNGAAAYGGIDCSGESFEVSGDSDWQQKLFSDKDRYSRALDNTLSDYGLVAAGGIGGAGAGESRVGYSGWKVNGAGGDAAEGSFGGLEKNGSAAYGGMHCPGGKIAVIEMAAAAGLTLVDESNRNPAITTTYGVGELIKKAVQDGCSRIILGLGGSCTNDAGAGMAAALGARFYDGAGRDFVPVGGNLGEIAGIDISGVRELLDGVSIEAMCDINNGLYGESGAAYVFGPQKGADAGMVMELDRNLRAFADVVRDKLGVDVSNLPKMGAAGGMGAGAYIFLGAELKQGIDVILDMIGFENLAKECRMIFTGEGQFDAQSSGGKAVTGISKRAKKINTPVTVIAGKIKGDIRDFKDMGINHILQTDPGYYKGWDELAANSETDLKKTMDIAMMLIGK